MKDVTDTVSHDLMAKVKAWGCEIRVTTVCGFMYLAESKYKRASGFSADNAVRNWLLDRAIEGVNSANMHARCHCEDKAPITLADFFRAYPEVAV